MRATTPLLVGLAVAAGGCFLSTSEFAPKTSAECVAQNARTKACGNRCVSVDDPANGCGAPGSCEPCAAPSGAHTVAACLAGACSWACADGWAHCGGATGGCETEIGASDVSNCGACGHACGTGYCSGGVCSPQVAESIVVGLPQPMARDATQTTILYALVDVTVLTTTVGVKTRICTVGASCGAPLPGRATALAARDGTWWAGTTDDDHLFLVQGTTDPTLVITVATAVYDSEWVSGILATPNGHVLFTTFEPHQDATGPRSWLHAYYPGYGVTGVGVNATQGSSRGVGGLAPWYYLGAPDAGGSLFAYEDRSGYPAQSTTTVLTGVGSPVRIVGSPSGHLFWLTTDGSLWRASINDVTGGLGAPQRIFAGTGLMSGGQLVSDADGVYWSDHASGFIRAWRASDGAVLRLSFSSSPWGLATDATYVYWTDDIDLKVYRVRK